MKQWYQIQNTLERPPENFQNTSTMSFNEKDIGIIAYFVFRKTDEFFLYDRYLNRRER